MGFEWPGGCAGVDTCRIDTAFLLLAAKPGARLLEQDLAVVTDPRPSGLHFVARDHHVWSDESGTVVLGLWQGGRGSPPGERCERWVETPAGIVASTGNIRWYGRAWTDEASWARELDARLEHQPLPDLARELRGIFTLINLRRDGHGTIAPDPLGFSFVYRGEHANAVAVASRAALCARAVAAEGVRPARDGLAACWPAYSRHWIGDRTGYEGVQLLPPGAWIELAPAHGAEVNHRANPWLPTDDLDGLSPEELLDLAYEELADSIRSTLTLPGGPHRCDLTGGKDSRLIAAVALREGVADDFLFQTFGPPTLADVRVATDVANHFGLRHEVRFERPDYEMTYADRVHAFVAATGGMVNIWNLKTPHGRWPEIRVSGLSGLLLRSRAHVDERAKSEEHLVRGLERMRFGATELLRPEPYRALKEMALAELLDPTVTGSLIDRYDSFDLRASQRHLLGLLEELESDVRVKPLTSARAVHIAYALGGSARCAELIHLELTRRYSDELAAYPFAGEHWRRPPGDLRLEAAPAAAPAADLKPESLIASLQLSAFGERSAVLRDAFGDVANPAWEFIDREVALDLVDRFEDLKGGERSELFGAATAAIWLADENLSPANDNSSQ